MKKTNITLVVALALVVLAAVISWKNMNDDVAKTTSPTWLSEAPSRVLPIRQIREKTETETDENVGWDAGEISGVQTTILDGEVKKGKAE